MRNKKKHNLLAHQVNPDGTQNHDLLQTYINPTPNKDSKHCRLEYLKKLYHFNFPEDDGKQDINSTSSFTDIDLDNILKAGLQGDEFCKKYCIEETVCSGRVIILYPKSEKGLPGNDMNKSPVNIADVPDHDVFQQNHLWLWNENFEKRPLLAGEYLILRKISSIIEACYKDYSFSVNHLALQLNMSVSQLNRKLNALTGHPAGCLIRLFRLQRSATFLREGNRNVSEVCFETGFNSLSYFCRSFKKQFGCSPSRYKNTMAEKLNIMRQKDN